MILSPNTAPIFCDDEPCNNGFEIRHEGRTFTYNWEQIPLGWAESGMVFSDKTHNASIFARADGELREIKWADNAQEVLQLAAQFGVTIPKAHRDLIEAKLPLPGSYEPVTVSLLDANIDLKVYDEAFHAAVREYQMQGRRY